VALAAPKFQPILTTTVSGARKGWRYQHVQAIIVSIDQYAEAATGNREYFLNKPHSLAGSARHGDVP
jgi:hypothetical protein